MKKILLFLMVFTTVIGGIFAQQKVILKGFVSMENNDGFVEKAKVTIFEENLDQPDTVLFTDEYGAFSALLSSDRNYTIKIQKEIFFDVVKKVSGGDKNKENQIFLKVKMKRKPGYIFEISLTEIKKSPDSPVDGITDALVEVYNNTTGKPVKSFKNIKPVFNINLNKGNHYTILIRKKGYLAKQLEAYLNINGCIICFDGVSKIKPGIKTKFNADYSIGKYIANIEMEKVFEGKKFKIENIYYDLGKWDIKPRSALELDKLAKILKLNPGLIVELGSHTDSRGSDKFNMELSTKRAKSAVEYLVSKKNIDSNRITYKGYGETQLVNKCENGVVCSEWQHSKNRRTEIKILGIINDNSKVEMIPLETMKNEELMEKKMREMLNSDFDIIQVNEEDIDIPINSNNETKDDSISKVVTGKQNRSPLNNDMKKEISGNSKKDLSEANDVITYKIVILFTRYPLPKGHIIYKNNPGLEEYKSPDNAYVLYLMGNYNSYEEAKSILESKWKKRNRKAYIVKFKNGKKVKMEE